MKTKLPYVVYSDGASRRDGRGGWGALRMRGPSWREAYGGEYNTTNNRMELTGAMEGLLLTPMGAEVILYTDSMYVIRGITESITQWKRQKWRTSTNQPVKNVDLWEALEEAANMRYVTWSWVKGHSGIPGNERADHLATMGVPPEVVACN